MIRLVIPSLLVLIPILSLAFGPAGLVFAFIADIILISLSVRIVKPNTVMAVEFFGKFNRILRPGLNFIIPIVETTKIQTLYRKNFSVDVDGITNDNVSCRIGLNVIYYVVDDKIDSELGNVYKSIYNIDDHRTMMRSTVDEQLRAMMVTFTHKNIFEKREEIGQFIESRLRDKLDTFGYRLDSIQVRDISLEKTVIEAMNKVIETEKLREAALNEGEADKIRQVKKAEAEKDSRILLGEGMAGQRMKIAEGFKESVDMIRKADDSLTGTKVLQFLLDSSRIETLGNIGAHDNAKLVYLNEDLEGRTSKLMAGSDIMDK